MRQLPSSGSGRSSHSLTRRSLEYDFDSLRELDVRCDLRGAVNIQVKVPISLVVKAFYTEV